MSLSVDSAFDAPELALLEAVEKLARRQSLVDPEESEDECVAYDEVAVEKEAFRDGAINFIYRAGDLVEDVDAPPARQGFINIKSAAGPVVTLKSTALWSLTKKDLHVCQDRRRRFFSERQAQASDKTHITVCEFVKIKVDGRTEIAQVVGFVALTGTKRELSIMSCPIEPPKDFKARGTGLILNIYAVGEDGKLVFHSAHPRPVNIKNFVEHYDVSGNLAR